MHASTTYAVRSPPRASSAAISFAVDTHRPDGGSRVPNTYVTNRNGTSRQIGQTTRLGDPTFVAARINSGCASHTSCWRNRPRWNSLIR